jgi:hypothetical protein
MKRLNEWARERKRERVMSKARQCKATHSIVEPSQVKCIPCIQQVKWGVEAAKRGRGHSLFTLHSSLFTSLARSLTYSTHCTALRCTVPRRATYLTYLGM